jgi:hypothetical protein
MRLVLPRLAGALLLAQLTACASLHALRPDLDRQIDAWVERHEYATAVATIQEVSPKREDYQALQGRLPEIRRAAAHYETRLADEALRLAAEQQWQAALDVIELGLDRVPDGDSLRKTREQVLVERDAYLKTLETRLLISRAEQLARDLPLRTEIAEAVPEDRQARSARTRAAREASQIAGRLLDCGEQARARQETYLALRCLRLAVRLEPDGPARATLAEVERGARRAEGKARTAKRQRLEKRQARERDTLVAAYKDAFATGDLARARRNLEAAAELAPADREILSLESQLRLAIEEQLEIGIEQGRRRYIVGDVQGALETWTPLLELDPNHKQLQDHIDRAERVLRNLRELEEREPTIKLPG